MSSVIPAAVASGLRGSHIQPPDQAVVPPNCGSFSTTSTFRPCDAAVMAVAMPEAPVPTTNTSTEMLSCVMPCLQRSKCFGGFYLSYDYCQLIR